MDDSTSHTPRADAFEIARKGYDRRQVDAYREANDARIEALEQHIQGLEANMSELGLDRPVDLAAELDVVGEEVKRVLQEARVAAEQMRSRAADDAARWRADADEESRGLRESTRAAVYTTREAVWQTGSEMLASAVDARELTVVAATERALFIQAEAEREASRLVGDARRERDESVGVARDEAERLVSAARQESESILSAAHRQADAAQERARALEVRRAELMAELETARATIAGTEVAAAPDEDPAKPAAESAAEQAVEAAVVEVSEDARTHWPEDEGAVKIVSPTRALSAEPVDADAMVAEVEAMRESGKLRAASHERPAASDQPETESEPGSEFETVPPAEAPSSSPSEGAVAEGDGGGQESGELPAPSPQPEPEPSSVPPAEGRGDAEERSDEAGGQASGELRAVSHEQPAASGHPETESELEPEPESEPEPSPVPLTEGRGDAEERSDDAGGQESGQLPAASSEAEVEAEVEPEPDPLAGLFAQLREPDADTAVRPEAPFSPSERETDQGSAEGQGSEELPTAGDGPDPKPMPEPVDEPSAAEQEEDGPTQKESETDPFALRERHLLPVQNRALRTIKRSLVEAQNQALENLRLVDGWEPDAAIVDGEVSEAITALARESMVAGFAAAAEMMGTDESPQPSDVEPGDPSTEFAGALLEAAHSTVVRSREAGAGHREIASSLSRVFRSWRTDEAERRVQFASRSAYHVGVAAALADLGAVNLAVTPAGRPCRECPANKGPWTITDGLPSGTMMPPALLECACTIVPSL